MSNYTDEELKRIADSIAGKVAWRVLWEIYKLSAPWILIGMAVCEIINRIIVWLHS